MSDSNLRRLLRAGDLVATALPPGARWLPVLRHARAVGAAVLPARCPPVAASSGRSSSPLPSPRSSSMRPALSRVDGVPIDPAIALVIATSGTSGHPQLAELSAAGGRGRGACVRRRDRRSRGGSMVVVPAAGTHRRSARARTPSASRRADHVPSPPHTFRPCPARRRAVHVAGADAVAAHARCRARTSAGSERSLSAAPVWTPTSRREQPAPACVWCPHMG